MANIRQIRVGTRDYTVAGDVATIYRALVIGMVRDEITGQAPRTRVSVRAGRQDVSVKVADDGIFGVAGYAEQVFPHLGSDSYSLDLVVGASGYREVARTVTIAPNSSLPVSMPVVLLRRVPIRLQGRVVKDTTARPPIEGAKILTVGGPSPTERTVALRTPLHFAHSSGVQVRNCQFTPSGAPKQLLGNAPMGGRRLLLSDRIGLGSNEILRLGPDRSVEYAVIESLDALPADPGQPGKVTLRNALRRGFPATAEVQRVTATVSGPNFQLMREADAGDGILILDAVPGADAVRVEAAASAIVEYHALGALTDDDGFYRLDGMGRLRAIDLDASATGFGPLPAPVSWTINYEQPVNIINFRLS